MNRSCEPDQIVYFFTDFGTQGPYLAQMESALLEQYSRARILNLLSDAPIFSPRPASYLLGALVPYLASGSSVVGVVDPGVGGGRKAILIEAAGRRFIGPDNGLFASLLKENARCWQIHSPESNLSATFHGRDLFAPALGVLLSGKPLKLTSICASELVGHDWSTELSEIIYIDHYGNAMTGLRADGLPPLARLRVAGRELSRCRTFSDVPAGEMFWYENSIGLVELAINQGHICDEPGIRLGTTVEVL